MNRAVLFLKSHVKGHIRNGRWISSYETKTITKQKVKAPQYGVGKKGKNTTGIFSGLWSGHQNTRIPSTAIDHPSAGDDGETVKILNPSKPTATETWDNPKDVAIATPGSDMPQELNGVPFAAWTDHPDTVDDWEFVDGQNDELEEVDLELSANKHPAAGVVIEEPDGRVWLVSPTNGFGGYRNTFPKGTVEDGLSLQASAIKEAYEESGLQVEIVDHLMDVTRSTSVTRYYLARRVGGDPADMGWESQAVSLVPKDKLYEFLNRSVDHGLAEEIGAGKAPEKTKGDSITQSKLF